jgi:glycosyltransferase involved in cell wall biosynthesis
MIHLVIREPIEYQRTLCRTLSEAYEGGVVAWFMSSDEQDSSPGENFAQRSLSEVGFRKLFRELRADPQAIVILGGWSSGISTRTLLLSALLRVPVFIWSDHPHPRKRNWCFEVGRRIYLRALGRHVAAFLACGRPTVSHLASLGIPREKIASFPYWVAVPERWSLPNRCAKQSAEPLRLLAVGRQVPVKQFEIAIRAVALANNESPACAELVFAGDGPERLKLEALASSLGCTDSVRFAGWLQNPEVFAELERSDALVLTSKFDAYGVVVLEAMAMGRAVLASSGVTAALDRREGDAILLHPPGDTRVLADQIQLLARDREMLRRASIAARTVAEEWRPARAATILDELLIKTDRGKRLLKHRSAATGINPPLRPADEARLTLEG